MQHRGAQAVPGAGIHTGQAPAQVGSCTAACAGVLVGACVRVYVHACVCVCVCIPVCVLGGGGGGGRRGMQTRARCVCRWVRVLTEEGWGGTRRARAWLCCTGGSRHAPVRPCVRVAWTNGLAPTDRQQASWYTSAVRRSVAPEAPTPRGCVRRARGPCVDPSSPAWQALAGLGAREQTLSTPAPCLRTAAASMSRRGVWERLRLRSCLGPAPSLGCPRHSRSGSHPADCCGVGWAGGGRGRIACIGVS